ncbi:MAG TPA: response regulator [Candidatus Methylomirabilis sp.]|jgi:two-component system cell cycle response regulator DivK|nr:response regulator [Candidatus Methylomirabilis sp.]
MMTILIIEDNRRNMLLVRELLAMHGFRALEASDAEEGIARAKAERPDLILMDLQLPGMDGLTATRLLRQDPATAAIPVIALTAHAMKGDRERALEAGCTGYIPKPIDTRRFLAQIRTFLPGAAKPGRA